MSIFAVNEIESFLLKFFRQNFILFMKLLDLDMDLLVQQQVIVNRVIHAQPMAFFAIVQRVYLHINVIAHMINIIWLALDVVLIIL
jgi:hypothetical protein